MSFLAQIQTLKAMQSVELNKIPISYFINKLKPMFEVYKHTARLENNFLLFRARNFFQETPSNVKGLFYPSSPSLGRANFLNKPVFYGSSEAAAALFETRKNVNVGDKIALSIWRLTKETILFPLGYGNNFHQLGASRSLPAIFPESIKKSHETTTLNRKLYNFFNDVFTRTGENESYSHTATIANFFLKIKNECGIVYPSLATHGNFENIALTTTAADKNLLLECVDLLEVLEINDKTLLYTCRPIAHSKTFSAAGEISWGNPLGDEHYRISPFNLDSAVGIPSSI